MDIEHIIYIGNAVTAALGFASEYQIRKWRLDSKRRV